LCEELAIRAAVEQCGLFITATTDIENSQLKQDLVRIIAAGFVKRKDVIDHRVEDRTVYYKVTIVLEEEQLSQAFIAGQDPRSNISLAAPINKPEKQHRGIDLLQALLLPGFDQAQRGQWVRASLFFAVEAGVLLGARALNARGRELDDDFKAFANEHWSYERYIQWRTHRGEYALEEGYLDRGFAAADLAGLDEAGIAALFAHTADDVFSPTGGQGSHILPGFFLEGYSAGMDGAWDHFSLSRTQQFYEMIGKYAQFQRGWELYGTDNGWQFVAQQPWHFQEFCGQSRTYMQMRADSNDKLILADRLMGLLVLNHVASFLDVLIQTRREGGPDLRVRTASLETGHGRQPGLSLAWRFR
jgi:hypothetical protein